MLGRLGTILLLSLFLVTAGCLAGDEAAPEAAPTSQEDPASTDTPGEGGPEDAPANRTLPKQVPAIPWTLEQTGCDQYHIFYVTTWSSWTEMVPEGFGPDGTDPTGQTTTAYQHVSRCHLPAASAANGENVTSTEVWFGVVVTPPEAYREEGIVLHLVPADIVVDGPELLATYQAWGLGTTVREGQVSWTDQVLPTGRVGQVTMETGAATYTLDAQLGPPQEGTAAGTDRIYDIENGTVLGYMDHAWPGWTDLGSGTLLFQAEGDAGAPPAYAGTVHQVSGTDVTVSYTPLV